MLRLFQVTLDAVVLVMLAVMYWLMPALTRRDLLFGVTVPANARETPLGQSIIRRYRLASLALVLLSALALALLALFASDAFWESGGSALLILVPLALLSLPYLWAYRASRGLRQVAEASGMPPVGEPEPVADLRPRRYSDAIPLFWEALPLALIAATALYLATTYAAAPAIIATHIDAAGRPNAYTPKTIGSDFLLVWFQLSLYILLTVMGVLLVRAKAQAGRASARFRQVWLRYLFGLKVLLMLLFGGIAASIAQAEIASSAASIWWVLPASLVFVAVVIIAAITLAVRTGQGGARLSPAETASDRMDDRYWKAGAIYVNRNDPSLFVEKRFGVGWTLNFGNPKAVIALVVIIAAAVLLPLLPLLLGK
jgi:uncharacterized membrane protein